MKRLWLAVAALAGALVLTSCDTGDYTVRYVVGPDHSILKTTDAGSTWHAESSGTTLQLRAVAFAGTKHGCAVGDHGAIVVTTDGATWNTATVVPTVNDLRGIDVQGTPSPSNPAWAVGTFGTILRSTDCSMWTAQSSGTSAVLNGVSTCRCAVGDGWVVGGEGLILATTNAGTNWGPQVSGVLADLRSVSFVSAQVGWAVGQGVILHTTDGGLTWLAQRKGTGESLNSVAFADSSHGYVVGDGGLILVTSDGGTTWSATASHTTQTLRGVSTILGIGPSHGDYHDAIAVGDHGTILMTQDGGLTWIKEAPGTVHNFYGTA